MTYLRIALALCLLGLVVVSFAENAVELDEDTGLERDLREISEDVAADSYRDVMTREKRHLRDYLCGICHPKKHIPVELPCHHFKWVTYKKKSRCGWWRRRHTCYKIRHRLTATRYCCSGGFLFKIIGNLHVCVKKGANICGGFFMNGPKYSACSFRGRKFCSLRYKLVGSMCYKK